MPNVKKCSRCKEDKPKAEFYVNNSMSDGLQGYCKECCHIVDRETRRRRKEHYEEHGPSIIRDSKVCATCKMKKPISQFGKRVDSPDGKLSYCKPCWSDYVRKAQAKARRLA